MDFQITVVILIAPRPFGIILFFHTPEGFPWFFSYSLSKSSWKASMLHPTANMRFHSHLAWGAESEQKGAPSPKLAPRGTSWVRRKEGTGTQTWILLSSFKTDTCCHLVPIIATIQWDSPTEASRWKNEAEALCAWSPENVPSVSQLQKHLCPTAFCWTAVKIYSVRLLSEFLTSQPEAGWSQVCPWAAAGSERDHDFQGLDEMCHKGVRGEPGAEWCGLPLTDHSFLLCYSINIYILSMV